MAVTGVIMVLFLIAHMTGNWKIFSGREAFDNYSHWLRTVGYPALPHGGVLWIIRIVLLASVLIHAYAAVALWKRARNARPAAMRYHTKKRVQQTYASRTMRWGGVIVALFVVYHLLHLTTNTIHPGGESGSPYERVVNGFQIWWVTLSYLVAMVAVGFHLRHGIWSATATLGFNNARRQRAINLTANAIALILTVGFLVPPFAVLFGVVE